MKTDELIALLTRDAGPAPRAAVARRLVTALLGGMAASAMLALALIGPVSGSLFATPVPWLKLGYSLALVLAAGWCAARLARPVSRAAVPACAALLVFAGIGVLAVRDWFATPLPERMPQLLGQSWPACPWSVLALSIPALLAGLWALKGLAPTRPGLAGWTAGLAAGAAGAFGYAFSCPEPAVTFVAVWYTAGIVLAGALGAALAPRVLQW